MNAFTSFFTALGALLGFSRRRQELVNTPEMQAAERAKTQSEIVDDARRTIQTRQLDEVRRRVSE